MIRAPLRVAAFSEGYSPKPQHPRQSLAVFQAFKQITPPSLFDVHDALNVCKGMRPKDAEDYCYSIGINYQNSIMYYDSVDYLKRCYKKQTKSR